MYNNYIFSYKQKNYFFTWKTIFIIWHNLRRLINSFISNWVLKFFGNIRLTSTQAYFKKRYSNYGFEKYLTRWRRLEWYQNDCNKFKWKFNWRRNYNRRKSIYIPSMPLTPSDSTLPFEISRLQFPIKVAFAITINKAQAQTLEFAGIWLDKPVFTHE